MPSKPDKLPDKSGAAGVSRVGTTLGKYRLLNVVGQGGMGVVYEGEDAVLQRRVAVKLLPESAIVDARVRERFLNEARAAARLNHPHAVTIYEIGRAGNSYYIAMELVRGSSMQEHLNTLGPLAWPEATRVVADACQGLAAAHAAGLVHRDIKPANIMRSEAGLVKLSDFGLACIAGQATTASTAVGAAGTPHFMSPEQCRNDQLDGRSDLYSLGATYYALLTGRPPYVADKPIEVMFAHCSREIPDPRRVVPELPAACATIIARAMAKYPADRYASASEMLAALQQILPGTSPSSHENVAIAEARPKPKKFRAAALALAAATGLGLLLAAMVWLSGWNRPSDDRSAAPTADKQAVQLPVQPALPVPWRARIPRDGLTLSMGGRVGTVAISADGKLLAAGCLDGDGGVWIWDLDRLEPRTELWPGRRFHALAFAPDSQLLVAGGPPFEGHGVRLWSVRKGGQQALATENSVRSVAFDTAGHLLAVGLERQAAGPAEFVKVWRITAGREVIRREQLTVSDFTARVETILVSRDGKTLICAGDDQEVQLRDAAKGTIRQKLATAIAVAGMALAPDGRTLAVVGANELQFWDLAKGVRSEVRRVVGELQCVAFRRDGRLLATGNQAGLVTLWNATTREETQNLRGHTAAVLGLAFAPDGRVLATASGDRTIRLWDVGERKP